MRNVDIIKLFNTWIVGLVIGFMIVVASKFVVAGVEKCGENGGCSTLHTNQ